MPHIAPMIISFLEKGSITQGAMPLTPVGCEREAAALACALHEVPGVIARRSLFPYRSARRLCCSAAAGQWA